MHGKDQAAAAPTLAAANAHPVHGRGVVWLAMPVVVAFALWGLLSPGSMTAVAMAATGWVLKQMGWLILLLSAGTMGLCGWLALGPHRRQRLGGMDARPEFSTPSWIAMLFAAGMGTGLVVWGAAEPAVHMLNPPGGDTGLPLATVGREAMILTHLHWGLHAWSIYALCGLVVGWFAFRRGRPALVSAPLRGMVAGRGGRALETGADVLGILAVTFGIAGTLVMGMLTVQSGLGAIGLDADMAPLVLAAVGMVALFSASTGIGVGIRILSNGNILLALGLMAAVLLLGPSVALLNIFVDSLGGYLAALPELSFRLRPFTTMQQWTADWTLTYLLWWLAWGPFVGVFIARISRGRTIGGFIAGVVLVPTLGSMLWFSILGGSVLLQLIADGGTGALADAVRGDPTTVTFVLLDGLPGGRILVMASVLLLLVFLVTSIDSGAWVLGMMSASGAVDPPVRLRVAWGVAMLLLAGGVLAVATLEVGRAMAIMGALPFPLILLAQAVALVRDIGRDDAQTSLECNNRQPDG